MSPLLPVFCCLAAMAAPPAAAPDITTATPTSATAQPGAAPARWAFPLPPDRVATLAVEHPDGDSVVRLRTRDGQSRSGFGWVADTNPEPGQVEGALEHLSLPQGDWVLAIHTPEGVRREPLISAPTAADTITLRLPATASGVSLSRLDGGGAGWAPADPDQLARVTVVGGQWQALAIGASGESADLNPQLTQATLRPAGPEPRRPTTAAQTGLIRGLMLPATLAIFIAGGLAGWRFRRTRGLAVAASVSLVLALWLLRAMLPDPGAAILAGGPDWDDPFTSATLLAATADSVTRLADTSTTYAFPEGHSWLPLGPAWLMYLLATPITWVLGPIAGHNLGVLGGLFLLGLATWALARQHGAKPTIALIASAGAILAPALVTEVDKLSLDRAGLATIPLFLLALERAAVDPKGRASIAAGLALAAAFYAQVYYGLYLAVAAPLLVLPRLIAPDWRARIGRFALVAVVAAAALAPGLITLQAGTADTPYQSTGPSLWHVPDLLHPVAQSDAAAWLYRHDPRLGGNPNDRPMATATDRLLAAVSQSAHVDDVLLPGSSMPGRGLFWGLALLGLVAARRRGAAARSIWDVAVLMAMAMGPLMRFGDVGVGWPGPYYVPHLMVPGFDQLKHPYRFLLMGSVIGAVPLAVGVSGAVERVTAVRWRRALTVAALGPGVVLLLALRPITHAAAAAETRRAVDISRWVDGTLLTLRWQTPKALPLPRPDALIALEPGAALALPLTEPMPALGYLAAAQARIPLINDPPHGMTVHRALPPWAETHPLLNAIAWESGSDRPRRRMGEPTPADARSLVDKGVRYVILTPAAMPGPELSDDVSAWLDARFSRVVDTPDLRVWDFSKPVPG